MSLRFDNDSGRFTDNITSPQNHYPTNLFDNAFHPGPVKISMSLQKKHRQSKTYEYPGVAMKYVSNEKNHLCQPLLQELVYR